MGNRIRRHLSFANLASGLALFLAVGGGTTAIALRGRNSVDSGDIVNGAVKTADLGRNAATGRKVKESTLGPVPLAVRSIKADDSDQLGGVDATNYQFGNGVEGAVSGTIDDDSETGTGRIDLGSATVRIHCIDPAITPSEISVADDAGSPGPSTAAPTDVWIDGNHDAITSDGGGTPVTPVAGAGSTTPVEIWSTDDVVTDMMVNLAWDGVNDNCVATVPIQQYLNLGGPASAMAGRSGADRPSPPHGLGFTRAR